MRSTKKPPSSPIQTLTVGSRISLDQEIETKAFRILFISFLVQNLMYLNPVAGFKFTAGRELHPTPKMNKSIILFSIILPNEINKYNSVAYALHKIKPLIYMFK